MALVIGSDCAVFKKELNFGGLAAGLYHRLTVAGGWTPAVPNLNGAQCHPDISTLKSTVKAAFAAANEAHATLLIAFIGHGLTTANEDFYLLAADSPADPDSDTGYHLAQGIREQLLKHSSLDGLIVLVDACEAGEGVSGAARRWVEIMQEIGGRMEVMVASGDSSAYDGCFTRTLVETFDSGVAQSGEYLLCADVKPHVAQCRGQDSQHLSFNGQWVEVGDPGLWLVPNKARRRDAAAGSVAAGVIDHLTRHVIVTASLREVLGEILDADTSSLRIVEGPAGCGKSTLLSVLVRPELVEDLEINSHYVSAVAFLDNTSTLESLADEWSSQLRERIPGFSEASDRVAADVADDEDVPFFDRKLVMPLQQCERRGRKIRLLVDGLDQPETGSRWLVEAAILMLIRDENCRHVRVIASRRAPSPSDKAVTLLTDTMLTDDRIQTIRVAPPAPADLARAVPVSAWAARDVAALIGPADGGWLVARLISELADSQVDLRNADLARLVRMRFEQAVGLARSQSTLMTVTRLIEAGGAGPVLPLQVLTAATQDLGADATESTVRDLIAVSGALFARSRPGLPAESVGLAHAALAEPLHAALQNAAITAEDAHAALARTLEALESAGDAPASSAAYARISAPRHFLAAGDSRAALKAIKRAETHRAADNRSWWIAWVPALINELGAEHPDALTARHYLAAWRGRSGDVAGAIADFEVLLADQVRVLGADHPDTLITRGNLAAWRGVSGDVAGAIDDFEVVLADRLRVLGADHPETLGARHNLAAWRGESGDVAGAIADFEVLLADQVRVLGADHPETLGARHSLAAWRGESGDVAGAIADYEVVLADRVRVLGADHPDTLITRGNLAAWRGKSGDVAGAIDDYEAVLADQVRVLGADHPDTLITRGNLAAWRGESGDVAGAIDDFEVVLADRLRVLGADHPATLITRGNLAAWRGESGDVAGAIDDYEVVLADRLRVLGADHPETLGARHNLAALRGESGDVAGAIDDFEVVLADQVRVLGADHPETLGARHNLAAWRGESGDVAGAIADFEVLLADQVRVLGADHPDTLITRGNLAAWRGESGDVAGAIDDYEVVLADRLRVLGADHPDTLIARHNLGLLREMREP